MAFRKISGRIPLFWKAAHTCRWLSREIGHQRPHAGLEQAKDGTLFKTTLQATFRLRGGRLMPGDCSLTLASRPISVLGSMFKSRMAAPDTTSPTAI